MARGVVVAIVDSGVDADHPGVRRPRLAPPARRPRRRATPASSTTRRPPTSSATGPPAPGSSPPSRPAAELVSIRVLGADNRGKGRAVAAAVEWAIEQGIGVVNLSLSSRSEAMFSVFHELADRAYFANILLVCAANNVPGPSYPSLFAAVAVGRGARHPGPGRLVLQPGAAGGVRRVRRRRRRAWRDGGRIRATGNSFAAPHLAGACRAPALALHRRPRRSRSRRSSRRRPTAAAPESKRPPRGPGRSRRCRCSDGSTC